MEAMPRPRLEHLRREKTRHGRLVWYFRRDDGPRVRLKGDYGSPEFMETYKAALRGEAPTVGRVARLGSLAWLIARYREVPAWTNLAPATRRQRENIFKQVLKTAGGEPFAAISEATIIAGRERRNATPFQARHFIDAMRGLFAWAKDAQLVKINPAADVKYPPKRKHGGFPAWTEDDLIAYEDRWPLGTKERVWLAVLLYTGLRRGDAVRLGRQHVRNGIAALRTEKSQEQIEVTIPLLPPLIEALAAGPTGDLAFICGERGRPMTKEAFGNAFSEAARAAGVRKSAHGVRKIGATRAANNGATVAQLEAIFGWVGGRMASHYTRSADRVRLAREGIGKLMNESGTGPAAPSDTVRRLKTKI